MHAHHSTVPVPKVNDLELPVWWSFKPTITKKTFSTWCQCRTSLTRVRRLAVLHRGRLDRSG